MSKRADSKRDLWQRRGLKSLALVVALLIVSTGQVYGATGKSIRSAGSGAGVQGQGGAPNGSVSNRSAKAFALTIVSQVVRPRGGQAAVIKGSGNTITEYNMRIYRKTRPEVIVFSTRFVGNTFELSWDGRDNWGFVVASGYYLLDVYGTDDQGQVYSDSVQIKVNNGAVPKVMPAPAPSAPAVVAPRIEDVSAAYPATNAAAIPTRMASTFVAGLTGYTGTLKAAMYSDGSQAYIRADDNGEPGEIIAAYSITAQYSFPQIYIEVVGEPVQSGLVEQGKTYWLEGPGIAVYSNIPATTRAWSPSGYWYSNGWTKPFAMELSVYPQ
jgi:hypothetical protein